MFEKEKFDMSVILSCIKKDIKKQKYIVLWIGFVSAVISFVLFPLSIFLFFIMFLRADLPGLDHSMIYIYHNTNYFLIPYDIMLVYYFVVMYFKDTKQHLVNSHYYKKAIIFSAISVVISILAINLGKSTFMMVLYFGFFITAIYYLSFTYYDIALKDAFDNDKNPIYKSEDLGWGPFDNPLTYKDDINRAKLFVQVSTVGFDFMILFINKAVDSASFLYAIRYKKHTQESVRMFNTILENRLKGGHKKFSYHAFNILKTINYLTISNDYIRLTKRGIEVAKKASTKDTFFTSTLDD